MHRLRFNSLEDYLSSMPADVDGTLNDGWGFEFPVKGREIDAAVLFADITSFSTRTLEMTPAETLIFVQTFFAWVTAEALSGRPGIVDKYIGDEVMVVFSQEFGSEDPVADAVAAAAAMSRHDVHRFRPHIGIAAGPVIVGYAGTALRYNVSVFGRPVALAARCAAVGPEDEHVSSSIVLPIDTWGSRQFDDVVPPDIPVRRFRQQAPRRVDIKGLGQIEVVEIQNMSAWFGNWSAEDRPAEGLKHLKAQNRYWPREGPGATGGA